MRKPKFEIVDIILCDKKGFPSMFYEASDGEIYAQSNSTACSNYPFRKLVEEEEEYLQDKRILYKEKLK